MPLFESSVIYATSVLPTILYASMDEEKYTHYMCHKGEKHADLEIIYRIPIYGMSMDDLNLQILESGDLHAK